MRDVIRRNWRFWVALAEILILTVVFARYLEDRQRTAEQRDERTRLSLCAILDRIPEHIDSGMDKARILDRCGHPHPPTVFFGHPFPTPTAPAPHPAATTTVTVTPHPQPAATTTILQPAPSRVPSPRPSPSHTPTPTPTPSPSCLRIGPVCV